jgi:hypothetical protein
MSANSGDRKRTDDKKGGPVVLWEEQQGGMSEALTRARRRRTVRGCWCRRRHQQFGVGGSHLKSFDRKGCRSSSSKAVLPAPGIVVLPTAPEGEELGAFYDLLLRPTVNGVFHQRHFDPSGENPLVIEPRSHHSLLTPIDWKLPSPQRDALGVKKRSPLAGDTC